MIINSFKSKKKTFYGENPFSFMEFYKKCNLYMGIFRNIGFVCSDRKIVLEKIPFGHGSLNVLLSQKGMKGKVFIRLTKKKKNIFTIFGLSS
jgi:hypothetical protein